MSVLRRAQVFFALRVPPFSRSSLGVDTMSRGLLNPLRVFFGGIRTYEVISLLAKYGNMG